MNPSLVANSLVATSPSPSSSSVFDGSIDHVWISFPEPPHHTHSSSSKRPRTSTTVGAVNTAAAEAKQPVPAPKKLFSYTRYDWNFLSTLSPTVLGWFCVINRIQKPMEEFLQSREKRVDAILAYFLIETTPKSTLRQSKLYDLFTPKTKYLLSHPVGQLVSELRKHFNKNTHVHRDLQPNIIPELQILKQGIREACRGWAQTIKQQPNINTTSAPPAASATSTSPINSVLPTTSNPYTDYQEQPPAVVRAPSMVDRMQRFIGHEFVIAHPRHSSLVPNKTQEGPDHGISNGSAVRRRTAGPSTRPTIVPKETIIEMIPESNDSLNNSSDRRRTSTFLGKIPLFSPFRASVTLIHALLQENNPVLSLLISSSITR